ncbi:MAG: TolC family protein [Fidelibacterota bacterium]
MIKLTSYSIKKVYLILTIFAVNFLFGQSYDEMVSQILENNRELKALRSMNRVEILRAKNELLPENPALKHEFKENDNYEIGITQSFRFPTFYYHQYKNLQLTKAQQKAVFEAARLKILEEAGGHLYHLAFLERQISIQKNRLDKASRLLDYFEKMMTEGESTQLAVNQAKIHKINYKNQLTDLLVQKNDVESQLKVLNGGSELKINLEIADQFSAIIDTTNLRSDYLQKNPALKLESLNHAIAMRNTKIAKQSWLPDFRIGVHREKETGPLFHYGISLPLWKTKNKGHRAKAARNAHQANQLQKQHSVTAKINRLLEQYRLLKLQYDTNLELKQSLNSEELLTKSLEVEEISAIEYFTELEKLYNFEDEFRKTRLGLQIVIVQLTSFRK